MSLGSWEGILARYVRKAQNCKGRLLFLPCHPFHFDFEGLGLFGEVGLLFCSNIVFSCVPIFAPF